MNNQQVQSKFYWLKSIPRYGVIFLLLVAVVFSFTSDFFTPSSISVDPGIEAPFPIPEPLAPPLDPAEEVRGVFAASVLNIDFPSKPGLSEEELKAELDRLALTAAYAGFNTVFFQVRPTADALYLSEIFPISRYLTGEEGKDIQFDPLSYLIEICAERDIDVVAWVNPYRITATSLETKEKALESLSENSPARLHPEWSIFYGGKLFFDPAIPEVRELVIQGVEEILRQYDVKGILFDDYFYPYPVSGEEFHDEASYKKYAKKNQSLADFRREQVNLLVKETYDAVKAIDSEKEFGISPFGIWQNSSSTPLGSDTKGFEAYSQLYCDALSWIKGGYIDYICPQIYWQFGNSSAAFEVLTRWWSAQVDGTRVRLLIGHAAYKVEEFQDSAEELINQAQFARSFMNVGGSVYYSYSQIQKNLGGIAEALAEFYAESLPAASEVQAEGLHFSYPNENFSTTNSSQFVLVSSDPNFPVYSSSGGKLPRSKSGLISLVVPLSVGKNTLTLTQNGKSHSLVINRKPTAENEDELKSFSISEISPSSQDVCLVRSGKKLVVSVTAPAGCSVTATVGNKSAPLLPSRYPNSTPSMKEERYIGEIELDPIESGGDYVSLGRLRITCSGMGKEREESGAVIRIIPRNMPLFAEVIQDYSPLKTSASSSFYEDFLNTSLGMCDSVIGYRDGYYELACGAFIAKENVEIQKEELSENKIKKIVFAEKDRFDLLLSGNTKNPVDVKFNGKEITVRAFSLKKENVPASLSLPANPLFSSASCRFLEKENVFEIKLSLYDERNYYGFDLSYEKEGVRLSFALPQKRAAGNAPLSGKTIIVDAGHGGSDPGAPGILSSLWERDANLTVALALAEKLKALGAEVILSRSNDSTVSLYERMDLYDDIHPDFALSIHHNSVPETQNPNQHHGALGLYWSKAGVGLCSFAQKGLYQALHVHDEGIKEQELAVCRNYKFPQALMEVGYLCNPAEYERILSPDYADIVSNGILDGIMNYYAFQESFLR